MTEEGFFTKLADPDFLSWANRITCRAHCTQDFDDLFQQFATKLFRRHQRANSEHSFKYLRTAFFHVLISHTRSAQFKQTRRTSPMTNDVEITDKSDFERRDYLRSMMKTLSVEQRAILNLHFLENLKIDEVAQRLAIPKNSVKSKLRRTLIQLRDTFNAPWN